MTFHAAFLWTLTLGPAVCMGLACLGATLGNPRIRTQWQIFITASVSALLLATLSLIAGPHTLPTDAVVQHTRIGLILAVLVQLLGTVIGVFSFRYLEGEPGQSKYIVALAGVLASVHILLMAQHWIVLIAAWSLTGIALHQLLCFYPDRPFARLAAHKKRLADRLADILLILAASLAWSTTGSGSFSSLETYIATYGMSPSLQLSALALVLAVILRTALLPVHGWLTQVMEAPTPVSALLHAGVVNLGGFVLILFAPLLEDALAARALLVMTGLITAFLAGMVMLTRISIKVKLAWSTIAQMGFMLVECGLGLYTLAAVHLIGHSLYKAHAFLSASSVVHSTRQAALRNTTQPYVASLIAAPVASIVIVTTAVTTVDGTAWPWWWNGIIGFAWAPVLWQSKQATSWILQCISTAFGVMAIIALTLAALLMHAVPLGLPAHPHDLLGYIALAAMALLYISILMIQLAPEKLAVWHRWSYAGFYMDEAYTRLALKIWPTQWVPASTAPVHSPVNAPVLVQKTS